MSDHDAAVARGFREFPTGMRMTQVRFDCETFEQIRSLALKRELNFSAMVRLLVEWGLEAEKSVKCF